MGKTAEYMRDYRARRKALGSPVPRGTRSTGPDYRSMLGPVVDPEDYSHPDSDVRESQVASRKGDRSLELDAQFGVLSEQ